MQIFHTKTLTGRNSAQLFREPAEAVRALQVALKRNLIFGEYEYSIKQHMHTDRHQRGWYVCLEDKNRFLQFLVRRPPPCGHTEPESDYREPETGKYRTARCEGGFLVVRGTGYDSVTDGVINVASRLCPGCAEWRL